MTLGKVMLLAASPGFKGRRNVLNHNTTIELCWKGHLCDDPEGVLGESKCARIDTELDILFLEKNDSGSSNNIIGVSLQFGETSNYESSPPPTPQHGGFRQPAVLEDDIEDDMNPKSLNIRDGSSFISHNSDLLYSLEGNERSTAPKTSPDRSPQTAVKPRYSRVKKYYNRQNLLLDAFLGSDGKQRLEIKNTFRDAGRAKLAIHASFGCDFCLIFIYLYASTSTGSLSLQAITGVSFVSITRHVRMDIQMVVDFFRTLAGNVKQGGFMIVPSVFVAFGIVLKICILFYCFLTRHHPGAGIFIIEHRYDALWLDPLGAILISFLTLCSWMTVAFEHMQYLVRMEEVDKSTVHVDYDESDGILPAYSDWYRVEDEPEEKVSEIGKAFANDIQGPFFEV
ncbi:hypothetical protein BDZ45DRAFT_747030 [Acephala macrosclerotiorum]|nr:hypothetical protein BDZ45DRAFT_747030 [Acephala macrosclerotiorum]